MYFHINNKKLYFLFLFLYFNQVKYNLTSSWINPLSPLGFLHYVLRKILVKKYQVHYISFFMGNSPRFDLAI